MTEVEKMRDYDYEQQQNDKLIRDLQNGYEEIQREVDYQFLTAIKYQNL